MVFPNHQVGAVLTERLITWAQNEEMVDVSYTIHGKDCRDVAALLRQIDDLWIALYGGESRCADAVCYSKRLAAIVDDLKCAQFNFRVTEKDRLALDKQLRLKLEGGRDGGEHF